MFSKFAWNGLSKFVSILKAIGHLPPFHYNPKTKEFEVNKNPSPVFWLLSLLNVAVICCGIPFYAAATRLYGFGQDIAVDQAILFMLLFSAGTHAIGLFISAFVDPYTWCRALNELIKIEKYLRGETNYY